MIFKFFLPTSSSLRHLNVLENGNQIVNLFEPKKQIFSSITKLKLKKKIILKKGHFFPCVPQVFA